MKHLCAALLTVVLAAFAPEDGGQNIMVCRATDSAVGETLEMTTRFTRNGEMFQLDDEVRLDGRIQGQEVHRALPASTFKFDQQLDRAGVRRLTLHPRGWGDERVKWIIHDEPGRDVVEVDLPAKFGAPKVHGALGGGNAGRTVECQLTRVK